MERRLDDLRPEDTAVVKAVNTNAHLGRRLQDFGFVPGTLVTCRYLGPGRKVAALEFRDTVVAMRTADLRDIRVVR